MPILPAEPDLYPPDLWEGNHATLEGRRWWCLHAKPRQEKAIARELFHLKLPYYLPMVVNEGRTPQGRKTRSLVPLFTSYVFLLGDDQERRVSLQGNRLVRTIEVHESEALGDDLRQVHKMLGSGLTVLPEPTMPVGARVRIMSGPLSGVEGKVVRRGKRDQFVAVVHILGCGAAVDLEDWQVERLPDENGPGTKPSGPF